MFNSNGPMTSTCKWKIEELKTSQTKSAIKTTVKNFAPLKIFINRLTAALIYATAIHMLKGHGVVGPGLGLKVEAFSLAL